MRSSAVKKLIVGTFALAAFAVFLGIASALVLGHVSQRLDYTISEVARRQQLAGRISAAIAESVAIERGIAMSTVLQQSAQVNAYRNDLGQVTASMKESLEEYGRLANEPEARQQLERVTQDYEIARGLHDNVTSLMNQVKMDEALDTLNSRLLPRLSQVSAGAKVLASKESDQLAIVKQQASTTKTITLGAMIALNLLLLGISAWVIVTARRVAHALKEIVGELRSGAREVNAASAQVSTASAALSRSATEQAASLEQTSASSEEIHHMTERNAGNARTAAEQMEDAARAIAQANAALTKMVQSMTEISTSSSKISNIIKVIDEIAFQTNILALNAAVEAARAGEAGMGFAVVADEVRNLAQRSAQAAKDTAGLIEDSIRSSAEGKQRLDEVARSIKAVTDSAHSVKGIVDEVHTSSNEQELGIQQIAQSVSRMSEVTHQVAATAEESAASGQELQKQANAVDEVVERLEDLVGTA